MGLEILSVHYNYECIWTQQDFGIFFWHKGSTKMSRAPKANQKKIEKENTTPVSKLRKELIEFLPIIQLSGFLVGFLKQYSKHIERLQLFMWDPKTDPTQHGIHLVD